MRVPSITIGVGVKVLVGFSACVDGTFVGAVIGVGIGFSLSPPQPTNIIESRHNAMTVWTTDANLQDVIGSHLSLFRGGVGGTNLKFKAIKFCRVFTYDFSLVFWIDISKTLFYYFERVWPNSVLMWVV